MQRVGAYLQHHANELKDADDCDRFARSAFNRYYYATFLIARTLYKELYPKAPVPGHSQFPRKIREDMYQKISKELTQATNAGTIQRGEAERVRNSIRKLTNSLQNLLSEGYELRKIADYEPEIRIGREGNTITLSNTSLHAAAHWPESAERACGGILKEWRGLGN